MEIFPPPVDRDHYIATVEAFAYILPSQLTFPRTTIKVLNWIPVPRYWCPIFPASCFLSVSIIIKYIKHIFWWLLSVLRWQWKLREGRGLLLFHVLSETDNIENANDTIWLMNSIICEWTNKSLCKVFSNQMKVEFFWLNFVM